MSVEHEAPRPVDLRRRLESASQAGGNGRELVSPELVLVDPELADRVRAQLPDQFVGQRLHVPVEPVKRARASNTVRALRLIAVLIFAGTLVSPGLTVLGRGDDESTPGATEAPPRAVRGEPRSPLRTIEPLAPAARAKPRQPPSQKPAGKPASRGVRTFVWVPVKGADAYEVQFFKGPRRVLLTRTPSPRLLVLRSGARGSGRRFVLSPGVYRWYVWPLFRASSSVRRGEAIVQAKLVVPR